MGIEQHNPSSSLPLTQAQQSIYDQLPVTLKGENPPSKGAKHCSRLSLSSKDCSLTKPGLYFLELSELRGKRHCHLGLKDIDLSAVRSWISPAQESRASLIVDKLPTTHGAPKFNVALGYVREPTNELAKDNLTLLSFKELGDTYLLPIDQVCQSWSQGTPLENT